jgi:hypothetical protein
LAVGTSITLLLGCAANTAYRGISVSELSDMQLVEELESAAAGLGVEINRTGYLMAVRPDPAYVLTSSTTSVVGSAHATYNAYAMPTGYGTSVTGNVSSTYSAQGTTRYQYTDVNASARLGNAIATAISRSRQEAYRERGLEVLAEFERRAALRRAETERVVDRFFADRPEMRDRRLLVSAVAPWAAAGGATTASEILNRTEEIISGLPEGDGLTGSWYGTMSQTTTMANGEVYALNEFVRMDLEAEDGQVSGVGVLGSGEELELSGQVSGSELQATVANTTSAINVRLRGLHASRQITGEFEGVGVGARLEGTFTLVR